ncbi:MAG TPA: cobalamin-binding protein [Desulfobacterales bacterium]|nr:cobalamin-binding protein [Desulfobacterales bacterium]
MKDKLKAAFLGMNRQKAIDLVEKALPAGEDPFGILKTSRAAMEEVGKRFATGEFFLSELIYSAEVFKAVCAILEPGLMAKQNSDESQGVVIIGTPKGDVHDLGKNLMVTLMRSHGFTVYDLGVDVPPENLVKEVKRRKAPILALSALITPAFVSMRAAIDLLAAEGLRKKTFVIIGGGVTTDFARKEIGADAQTMNPAEAIRLCRRHLNGSDKAEQL